jgi:hypothetical protein
MMVKLHLFPTDADRAASDLALDKMFCAADTDRNGMRRPQARRLLMQPEFVPKLRGLAPTLPRPSMQGPPTAPLVRLAQARSLSRNSFISSNLRPSEKGSRVLIPRSHGHRPRPRSLQECRWRFIHRSRCQPVSPVGYTWVPTGAPMPDMSICTAQACVMVVPHTVARMHAESCSLCTYDMEHDIHGINSTHACGTEL